MADRVGQRFGDYLLIRHLGEGGFGDVYLGEHVHNKSQAAVKILKTHLKDDTDAMEFVNKLIEFINEASTFNLQHPNIARLITFGVRTAKEEKIPFLVLEYAPNGSLRHRHRRGEQLPLSTIVSYVKQIASALQYAHDQRRIHRDVKPENILLGPNNEVLLSDFGIAAFAHSTESWEEQKQTGTPNYSAPEQIKRKALPASDQYSLAVMVYEWLCGMPPFKGNVIQVMYQQLEEPPPPLRQRVPALPLEVEKVVFKALAKDPKERFVSVQAFADALEEASLPRKPSVGTIHRIYRGHTGIVWDVKWSPDGRRIASSDPDHVHIWDPTTGTLDYFFEEQANGIEWSPNSKYLAIRKNGVEIWNVKAKKYVATYDYERLEYITRFAWSSDSKHLAFTGRNRPVEIYKFDKQQANVLVLPGGGIDADAYSRWILVWSPDGSRIATIEDYISDYSEDYHRASVWDVIANKPVFQYGRSNIEGFRPTEIYSHKSANLMNGIAWSPDSLYLAWISTSPKNVIQICDATTDRLLATHYLGSAIRPIIVFSPNWSRIASTEGKLIHLWDAVTGKKLFTYCEHTSEVLGLAWSPDSSQLASFEESGIYLWQAN